MSQPNEPYIVNTHKPSLYTRYMYIYIYIYMYMYMYIHWINSSISIDWYMYIHVYMYIIICVYSVQCSSFIERIMSFISACIHVTVCFNDHYYFVNNKSEEMVYIYIYIYMYILYTCTCMYIYMYILGCTCTQ